MTSDPVAQLLDQALTHHQAGRFTEAEAGYRRVLRHRPDHIDALHLCGLVARQLNQHATAVDLIRRALALKPDFADAYYNLGNALKDLGRHEEAIDAYRTAVRLKPGLERARYTLGNVLQIQGRLEEAIATYREALVQAPDSPETHYNLAFALQQSGRPAEAIASLETSLRLRPDNAEALVTLAHLRQHVCDWDGLDQLQQRAFSAAWAGHRLSPFILAVMASDHATQFITARNWVRHKFAGLTHLARRENFRFRRADKERLRIGYLSADYRQHATTYLVTELFELHDRRRFEVVAYSYGPDDGSENRRRIEQGADRFIDVGSLSFVDAARRIHRDGIDILVDLKGYTRDTRTEIVALRPAPIQVNYLGYPGTMGAEFMDYILVDPFVVPADQQPFYAERLVHLPDCYQVNDRRRPIDPRTPGRAECGLPERGFVFCSFNNSYKITREMFAIWMRLLAAVPDSVLWMVTVNDIAAGNLRREAAAHGIDPARLVFAPPRTLARHLARYRHADLFLDTFPVNAHTTASDALWAGCPVLTCAGDTFVSRVAGSLLHAVGLPELVTTSLAEYEALALRLVRDRDALAALRRRLEDNRATAPLFDTPRFTRNLEAAYEAMWRDWLAADDSVGDDRRHAVGHA